MSKFSKLNKKYFWILGIIICSFFISNLASAATYYWVGSAGGNTNAKANWNSAPGACSGAGDAAAAPTASDIINFTVDCSNDATINANLSVATTTISGYAGTITQATNITFTSPYYSQSSGNFSGGNGAITIGTFSLTGGIATTTSGTMKVANDFTVTGATFNHNNGLIIFDRNSGTVAATINASGVVFNNIQFGLSNWDDNGTKYFILASNFTVNGNIAAYKGYYSGGVYVYSTDAFPSTITLYGNFSMVGQSGYGVGYFGATTTINMVGDSKSFTISQSTSFNFGFRGNLNFNGTGTTTVNTGAYFEGRSAPQYDYSTTTVNQSSGLVVLTGTSTFSSLVINPGKVLDVSSDGGTSSYGLVVMRSFNDGGTIRTRNNTFTMARGYGDTSFIASSTFNNFYIYVPDNGNVNSVNVQSNININGNLIFYKGYAGRLNIYTLSSAITINVGGDFTLSTGGWQNGNNYLIIGNSSTTINMTGDNKSFTIPYNVSSDATVPIYFRSNLNFNGTGTTTVRKGGVSDLGTTTINQASGAVALSGDSTFYGLNINSGKVFDMSTNNGTNSYNLYIYKDFNDYGGDFRGRTGTTSFYPYGGRYIPVNATTTQFNNVTFYPPGTGSWLCLMSDMIINGNLYVGKEYSSTFYVYSCNSPKTISLGGNFSQTAGGYNVVVFGNSTPTNNITVNMTGANKSFTTSSDANGYFRAHVNFNGTGTTTVSKADVSDFGTTTINQASGVVALSANSKVYGFTINSGKVFDASPDNGTNSYILYVYKDFNDYGGDFRGRNGTVYFLPVGNAWQPITATTTQFNNVIFYGSGTNAYMCLMSNMTVNGNLTHTCGYTSYVYSCNTPKTITLYGNYSQSGGGSSVAFFGHSTPTNNIILNMVGDNKTFTVSTPTANSYFRGDLIFAGTGTTTVSKNGYADYSGTTTINQNSTSTVVLSAASTFYTINIATGTLDLAGNNLTLNASGFFNIYPNGTLKLQGGETISNKSPTSQTGGTVKYSGTAGPYTLKSYSYSQMAINGGVSSVFSFPAALSLATTTINSGILSLAGYGMTSPGLMNYSTLRLKGSEAVNSLYPHFDSSSITEYVGDADAAADTFVTQNVPYGTLKVNFTDTTDILGDITSAPLVKGNNSTYVFDKGAVGKFDATHVSYVSLLKENGLYKMWYSGYSAAGTWTIGYATSSNGITWNRTNNGNAVLGTTAGKFDSNGTLDPTVINDGGTYKMWYSGYSASGVWAGIGYATSPDGITWTKQNSGNAVLSPGSNPSFDYPHLYTASVIKDGSVYRMWYGGNNNTNIKIGYATSSDGITWTKYSGNPILSGTAAKFDSSYAYAPKVIKSGSTYLMFYGGYNGSVWGGFGYAASSDGATWTKLNNGDALITRGTTGTFDVSAIYCAAPLVDDNQLKLYYSAYDASNQRIGIATSTFSTTTSLSGDLNVLSGTYVPLANLNLNGTNQTVSLLATSTVSTLNKTASSSQVLTFGTAGNLIITGTTTLRGTSTSTLYLHSTATDTQWHFEPDGGRDFAYLDVQDSHNTSSTTIDTSLITGYVDSGNNTGWGAAAGVTVGSQGTQIATTTIPVTSKDLGGAFTFIKTAGTASVSSIVIHQTGSLSADTNITNLKLYYEVATTCASTKPVGATLFGNGSAFVNNISTTTGSMSVGASNTCLYAIYDIPTASSEALVGYSINLEITNPATDVIAAGSTAGPASKVNIRGQTVIVDTSVTTSMLSLKMSDPAKDPTVFYLKDDAVWKKEGANDPLRLTNANLKVTSLIFTDLTGVNSGGTVKMQMTTSNVNVGEAQSFLDVTRTYSTTATVKAWQGGN